MAKMFFPLVSWSENIFPVNEVEALEIMLNRFPVVKEVAEIEATLRVDWLEPISKVALVTAPALMARLEALVSSRLVEKEAPPEKVANPLVYMLPPMEA